jgi:putative ABC transport system permease protein
LQTLLHDLRYGARMLAKHPGFTLIAVITLALGIGATMAVFSVVDAWLLRPLPFKEPESLAGYFWRDFTLTGADGAESLLGQIVTPGYFATLGIAPLHGRTFRAEDAQGPPVVMLGHGFWQRQFGGAPDVIGKTLTLNDKTYTVIGVAPPGHSLPSVAQPDRTEDVWLPVKPDEPLPFERSYREAPEQPLGVVARLKPGHSAAQAKAELEAIKTRSDAQHASTYTRFTTFVANLQQDATRSLRPTLLAIAGAAGFVWLIVCANVAGLLLARVAERRKELAIRSALGASRAALARQMLIESVLLALLGGVFGVLLAQSMLRGFLALQPFDIPAFNEIALLLAVLGLYGVISYSVLQRTPEIGVRLALGAQTRDVLRLVLAQGLRLTLGGLALGAGGALALTRWLKSLLYGVSAHDPLTFGLITALLTVTALLACWIPARRATKVNPTIALRSSH